MVKSKEKTNSNLAHESVRNKFLAASAFKSTLWFQRDKLEAELSIKSREMVSWPSHRTANT